MAFTKKIISQILNEAFEAFKDKTGKSMTTSSTEELYFRDLANDMSEVLGVEISPNTYYRQVWIPTKKKDDDFTIKLSRKTLDRLVEYARLVHKRSGNEVRSIPFSPMKKMDFLWMKGEPAKARFRIKLKECGLGIAQDKLDQYLLELSRYQNVFVKDDSSNSSGLMYERWAEAVCQQYRQDLASYFYEPIQTGPVPRLSVMPKTKSALVIQYVLRRYNLPALKVIFTNNILFSKDVLCPVDEPPVQMSFISDGLEKSEPLAYSFETIQKYWVEKDVPEKDKIKKYIDQRIRNRMALFENAGCEVYYDTYDQIQKARSITNDKFASQVLRQKVLEFTENQNGFDLTTGYKDIKFYEELCKEICMDSTTGAPPAAIFGSTGCRLIFPKDLLHYCISQNKRIKLFFGAHDNEIEENKMHENFKAEYESYMVDKNNDNATIIIYDICARYLREPLETALPDPIECVEEDKMKEALAVFFAFEIFRYNQISADEKALPAMARFVYFALFEDPLHTWDVYPIDRIHVMNSGKIQPSLFRARTSDEADSSNVILDPVNYPEYVEGMG